MHAVALAVRAGVAFARTHGVWRALRLAIAGASALGPDGLVRRAANAERQAEDDARYAAWLAAHPTTGDETQRLGAVMAALNDPPLISVVCAVYNTEPRWLARCVASIRAQTYPHWELCLCDDGSTRAETAAALAALEGDAKIRIAHLPANAGIVHASNAALALAAGEFVAFVDHDDELAPEALAHVVARLAEARDLDILYSDEDKIDEHGTRREPHFKPDWSPELLRSCMYVSHLTVMRRSLALEAGGFRAGFDGAQDYDLMLRASARTDRIAHLPSVLYHWRMTSDSVANSQLGKPWAVDAGRRALEEDAERRKRAADVTSAGASGHYRVRYRLTRPPLVSVVLHAAAAEDAGASAIRDLRRQTRYGSAEYIAVAAGAGVGALNRAIRSSQGLHVLLIDADLAPRAPDWLEALLEFADEDAIGGVGGLVLAVDGTIETAGLVMGIGGAAGDAFHGEPEWTRGHLSNILDVRNVSAVSGACLLTRRSAFEAAGGLDERLTRAWDVDYGLRLRRAHLRAAI
jgi:GT2 family glycosyltransferase